MRKVVFGFAGNSVQEFPTLYPCFCCVYNTGASLESWCHDSILVPAFNLGTRIQFSVFFLSWLHLFWKLPLTNLSGKTILFLKSYFPISFISFRVSLIYLLYFNYFKSCNYLLYFDYRTYIKYHAMITCYIHSIFHHLYWLYRFRAFKSF